MLHMLSSKFVFIHTLKLLKMNVLSHQIFMIPAINTMNNSVHLSECKANKQFKSKCLAK